MLLLLPFNIALAVLAAVNGSRLLLLLSLLLLLFNFCCLSDHSALVHLRTRIVKFKYVASVVFAFAVIFAFVIVLSYICKCARCCVVAFLFLLLLCI